ncbi:MAG TPA: hypothetical protein VMW82_00160, partial [Candidatus Paceibacterota bacterium]|nr:hypothetical protein [Candidatus Paceibacterota bacterium]
GIVQLPCQWTAKEVAKWNGPYASSGALIDPWNNIYIFDPDYFPWMFCPSKIPEAMTVAVFSYGGDSIPYNCNDIFIKMK